MNNSKTKRENRERRHKRIRAKISGTSLRPRLSVFKSNTSMQVQLIDDISGITLASVKGSDPKALGADIAKKALAKKIDTVVFDRGGYLYTGKIANLATSARKAGLKF